MAYDVTQPTDSTKLRNIGTVIRPNWVAIRDADSTFKPVAINFAERNAVAPPISNDPTALAQAYLLYCKQDAAGNPELFGINASSDILQLTKGAAIVGTNGETCLPGGVLIKWGTASANGAASFAFVADFALTAFPNNCFQVIATARNSGTPATANDYIYTHSPLVTGFSAIATRRITLASTPVTFYWLAIGN
jgi:hypothetical protein